MANELVPFGKDPLNLAEKLPLMPGWAGMSEKERMLLQQYTSNAREAYREGSLRFLQFAIEVERIDNFIADRSKGAGMKFWAENCAPCSSGKVNRALRNIRVMRKLASPQLIAELTANGITGMNEAPAGRLITVMEKIGSPLKSSEPKIIEGNVVKLREGLRKSFQDSNKGHTNHDPDKAAFEMAAAGAKGAKSAKLNTSAERRALLKKGGGYFLELLEVTGSVTIGRIPIPDGLRPNPVGRPKGKKRTKRQ